MLYEEFRITSESNRKSLGRFPKHLKDEDIIEELIKNKPVENYHYSFYEQFGDQKYCKKVAFRVTLEKFGGKVEGGEYKVPQYYNFNVTIDGEDTTVNGLIKESSSLSQLELKIIILYLEQK